MDSVKQLQKKLDSVFQNGALFTYRMSGGASATQVASRAWALREHNDTVLIGVIFPTISRHWLHRISDVKKDGEGFLLTLANGKSARILPLNTKFADPTLLEKIENEDRIKEELLEEVDSFLEANPHKSLDNF
jgi:hypothetical protein